MAFIGFNAPKELKEKAEELAVQEDRTLSSFLRTIVNEAINKKLETAA